MESKVTYNVSPVKPWACRECGRTLGVIARNADKIPELAIVHVKLIVRVTMRTEVTCPVCNTMKVWRPGEEVLERLVRREVTSGKV